MKQQLRLYLDIAQEERAGIAVLAASCMLFLLVPEVTHWCRPKKQADFSAFKAEIAAFRGAISPLAGIGTANTAGLAVETQVFSFDPNTASFEDFTRLGLSERVSNTILNYREHGGRFYEADDFQKIYGLALADFERLQDFIEIKKPDREGFKKNWETERPAPAELFSFDPNTASEADFQRLGLSAKTARVLVNYRAKGAVFRKKSDLQKIWSLSPEDYARLEPFIALPEQNSAGFAQNGPRPVTYAGGSTLPGFGKPTAAPATFSGSLDINAASLDDWRKLPGIGESRAQRLLIFREKLGGFTSIEQVAEARGLPDSVFQVIRPFLRATTPVFRKIKVNTASAEDFEAHPYFDRRQTSLILAYRAQHGAFKSVDDLGKIGPLKNAAWLEKVRPYLEF